MQQSSQESKDMPMQTESKNSQENESEKMSNESGEFDRKPEKAAVQNKKSKGKKKTAKHEDSQDSIIRVGDNNNNTE